MSVSMERGYDGYGGSSLMKPKKISADPPYPSYPRSVNPYTDMKNA